MMGRFFRAPCTQVQGRGSCPQGHGPHNYPRATHRSAPPPPPSPSPSSPSPPLPTHTHKLTHTRRLSSNLRCHCCVTFCDDGLLRAAHGCRCQGKGGSGARDERRATATEASTPGEAAVSWQSWGSTVASAMSSFWLSMSLCCRWWNSQWTLLRWLSSRRRRRRLCMRSTWCWPVLPPPTACGCGRSFSGCMCSARRVGGGRRRRGGRSVFLALLVLDRCLGDACGVHGPGFYALLGSTVDTSSCLGP